MGRLQALVYVFGLAVAAALCVPARASSTASAANVGTPPAGIPFRECKDCPEMVVVPAGTFAAQLRAPLEGRGDFSQDPKLAPLRRTVMFATSFAVATRDITRAEYARFVLETGRPVQDGCSIWNGEQWINDDHKNWRNPSFAQTQNDPVVCVSWEDAQAYIRWLNAKIGAIPSSSDGPYRLPTWEKAQYAAAAGASTSFYWGGAPSRDRANYGLEGCNPCNPGTGGTDRWLHTSPVASFPSNAFGLYDMAGNVSQWTDTCFEQLESPGTETANLESCRWAVTFGGSWRDDPTYLKLSEYGAIDREHRNSSTGFRITRDLSVELSPSTGKSGPPTGITSSWTIFRDCPHCPLMKLLPTGHFTLKPDTVDGNSAGKTSSEPSKSVHIAKPFAIGVYDVTRVEFAAFVRETGLKSDEGCQYLDGTFWRLDPAASWQKPGFAQTDRDPVVCVNWEDAQAYVEWLNGKRTTGPEKNHGGRYRLPSGAEWLYAARGGLINAIGWYWGHLPSHDHANFGMTDCGPCGVAKEGKDRWYYTSPVGSFAANDFGLYDMVGNVWQWTNDCAHEGVDVSADGSVWSTGQCQTRVLFGGSYDDDPFTEQIDKLGSNRNPYPIYIRNYANGFRVALSFD